MRFFALWIKYKYKIKMKKRICLSIVIVFCLTGIYAQEKKHSIGISITPQVNISNLRQKVDPALQMEKGKWTGTGGALSENIYYQLQYKNLGFRIGLGYTNMNYTYRYPSRLSDYYGVYMMETTEYEDRTEITFISLPLSFFYDFYHKNRFSIGANAGIGVEFLATENKFDYHGGYHIPLWRSRGLFFSRLNLSAIVGLDFIWTFDNGLGLGITPSCSYFLINTIRGMVSKSHSEHYWLPGIACKAFYTFQKKDKQ
jgi:hypothetical protein